jgi:hypothetical protein
VLKGRPIQPLDDHCCEIRKLLYSIKFDLGSVVQGVGYTGGERFSARSRAARGGTDVTRVGAVGR